MRTNQTRALWHPRPVLKRTFVYLLAGGLAAAAMAASTTGAPSADAALVRLPGHVHRLTRSAVDAGEAPEATPMQGLDLVLAKTAAQEKSLIQFLADLQDPKSPQYHHWLTPAEFGRRFGASDAAIRSLSQWLRANGLEIGEVPASRTHLPFTGTKAQVEAAFHTAIHLFDVQGERHYANVSDPMVPATVQPLIRAVRGLNDFNPKPGVRPSRAAPRPVAGAAPGAAAASRSGRGLLRPNAYYPGSDRYPGYVGPSDFAVIYNLTPLYQDNITGAGVTVAIAAQSDLDASVLTSYWAAFGVAGPSFGLPAQSFTSMPVPPGSGGTDPGQTKDGNEDEAYLDSEILGALAPGAKLVLVRDMSATTAAQYVIDQNLAAVLNISFSTCESDMGSAGNAAIEAMYQQAVSEGITITVSSDDAGGAGCTAQADIGTLNDVKSNGFAVNGLASTPYNLAVGGTDFNQSAETSYWNTFNQPGTFASATSHIPEIVWNDSCANPLFAQAFSLDPIVFCNTATLATTSGTIPNPFLLISGGGGGVSSCTSADSQGNCISGYAQPSWQANVAGISSFGGRALPDVSMIATRWLVCSFEITTCNPANAPSFPTMPSDTIQVFDGTSASAPSVAAIVAMVDQAQISGSNADGRQGLINPKLYQFAGFEYSSTQSLNVCNANQGEIPSLVCVFYDVVTGSNAQPCEVSSYATSAKGTLPAGTCANDSNTSYKTGIMESGGTQDYAASAGFDIATGLGSINAAGLVGVLQTSAAPTGLTASAAGTTVTLGWNTDASASGGFYVFEGTASGQESVIPVQAVTATSTTVTGLSPGLTYYFEINAGTALGASPFSNEASATLAPAAPTGLAVAAAGAGALTLSWTASTGATSYRLFEGTSAGGEGSTAVQTNISGATVTLMPLIPGQQYFFKLQAVNAGGMSAQSAEASGTVVPTMPTSLAATAGNGSVSLTWSAAAGAKTYNVFDGTSSGAEKATPVMTGLTSPSASVTGLSNGTTYYFTVAAVDAGGASAQSAETHAVPVAPGGGGGGAMDWIGLSGLAALAISSRRTPSSRRRTAPRGRNFIGSLR